MAKEVNITLTKEVIEHLISKHYHNCNNFKWNGYEVSFDHTGQKPDIDVMRVISENHKLHDDCLKLQGAINFSSDVLINAIHGGGMYAQEI